MTDQRSGQSSAHGMKRIYGGTGVAGSTTMFRKAVARTGGLFGLAMVTITLAGCVVEAPPQQSAGAAPGYGYTCYAGVYVCRIPQQIPSGSQCSCPGIGAPSYGTVH